MNVYSVPLDSSFTFDLPTNVDEDPSASDVCTSKSTPSDGTNDTNNVKFELEFDLGSKLGSGTFGNVHKCVEKATRREFAVKVLQLKTLPASQKTRCLDEARICKLLDHENVVHLHNIYHDTNSLWIVFEFVSGGELFYDIVSREHYSEQDASSCMRQVLSAVEHFHAKGIIHRDLKPENILLSQRRTHSSACVKVADFGLAVQLPDGCKNVCVSVCGTPGYIAPEALKRQAIGLPVDMWSCGVLLYIMLVGYPPFWARDRSVLFEQIKEAQYIFNSPDWDNVSASAKSLVRSLLTGYPQARITATEATSHPWISMSPNVAKRIHRQSTIQKLIKFNARRRLKLAIMTALASARFRKRTSAFNLHDMGTPSIAAVSVQSAPVMTTNPFFPIPPPSSSLSNHRINARSVSSGRTRGGGGGGTEPFISQGSDGSALIASSDGTSSKDGYRYTRTFNDPLPVPLMPDAFPKVPTGLTSMPSTDYDSQDDGAPNVKRTKTEL
eukprot:m.5076 g.5076  ORF g.5076 m.5076 type:complete len:498 (+) comp12042_c0_seq2:60-1553(+)